MMNASATAISCFAQASQLRLEQSPDLVVGDSARAQPLDGGRDDGLSRAKLVRQLFRPGISGDERPSALTQLDDALVLELAVRLGHGVRIDHELLRKRTNTRQLFTR